jgi:hypothetical protein
MATISRLKPGQTLWQIRRQKCGNTTVRMNCLFPVLVISIAEDGKSILASWNTNPARKMTAADVAKLKVKKPEPKGKVLGMDSY